MNDHHYAKPSKRKRESGQGLIEFALVLPALLLTLMGIADFGRLFAVYSNLFGAAREGARYGVVNPTDVNGISLTSRDKIKFVADEDIDVFVHFDSGPNTPMKDYTAVGVGDRVIVTLNADVEMKTPFIRAIARQLHVETIAARTISSLGGVGGGGDPPAPPTATPDPANPPTATPSDPNTPTPTTTGTPDPVNTPVPTPDVVQIQIDVPLWDGDVVVTGIAEPGETVSLRDIQNPLLDLSATVGADGRFQFNLPVALVAGHVISVQGYSSIDYAVVQGAVVPTATPVPTVTPTPTPTPSTQYIDVFPNCGPDGSTIDVVGHQWPVNKGDLLFFWDGVSVKNLSARSDFDTDINASGGTGTHTVTVQTDQQGHKYNDSKQFEIPCPSTPTPTPSQPNLVVESIALDNKGTLSTYDPLTFTVGVRNIGAAAANSLFWVDLYADPAALVPLPVDLASEVSVAWVAVASLAQNESISLTLNFEEGFSAAGQHLTYAMADSWDQVLESNEQDNVSGPLTVTVPLEGVPPTPTPTPTPGGVMTGAISGSTWLYINGDVVPQGRVSVAVYDGDELVAETLSDQDGNYVVHSLPPGSYTVIGQTLISGVPYSDIVLNVVVQSGQTTDYVTLVLH